LRLLSAIALGSTLPITAHAAPIVAVTLQDTSTDPSISGMVLKIELATTTAERVTLEAVNRSKR